jgi:glycosyltransferase involved in cell wall biosynthesis
MPRVSICIPTYNRRGLVWRAIESALSQSETDIEVILVDDVSTDGTLDVAASYNDIRLRIEKNDRHVGLGGNFNRCLEIAQGTYVKFLCDDDVLYPRAVAELADGLDRFPEATFATSAWNWIDADGAFLGTTRLLRNAPTSGTLVDLQQIVATSWLWRNRIGSPTEVLLRRDAVTGLRFNENYAQMMDWYLWLRLLKRGPLVYFPQILSAIRTHEPSLSARNRPLAQSASDLLNISTELADSRSELHGVVGKFDLKRLQLLCLFRAFQIALGNTVRGDWRTVRQNLGIVKSALGILVY